MQDQTDLDEIWFIVSPQNPLKKRNTLLHEFDRLRMVELAIGNHDRFRASDIEFHMPRPSYTIDTLAHLSEKYPQHEFKLVIGGDNLKSFHKWKNSDAILDYYGLYVYPRPQETHVIEHPNIRYIHSPMIDISATFVRNAVKNGHSVKYLLPEAVEAYVRSKKFFL